MVGVTHVESAFNTCPNDPIDGKFHSGGSSHFSSPYLSRNNESFAMLCNLRWIVLNPWWHWTHSDVKRTSIYIRFLSGTQQGNNSYRQWLDVISIWGRQIAISCSTYNGEERLQTIQWKHTMETSSSLWFVFLPFPPPPYQRNHLHHHHHLLGRYFKKYVTSYSLATFQTIFLMWSQFQNCMQK